MKKEVKPEIPLCNFFAKNQRGQVWVETVIYTLIAFGLIGLVLAFAKPKIIELQDKAIIEQSVEMMQEIDLLFTRVIQGGSGNKRIIEVAIRKGSLKIDGNLNKIIFEMDGRYLYSESGQEISKGNLKIITEEKGKINSINITRDFSNYNLKYEEKDELKTLSKATNAYNLLVSNLGKDTGGKTIINIELN